MHGTLFGVETEYALAAAGPGGQAADRGVLLGSLMRLAATRLRHLPDASGHGLFLENGSRLYADAGLHPGFCTPECGDPAEVVRYLAAGDRLLAGLLPELVERHGLEAAWILKTNVDYASRASWGCHESYLHRAEPSDLPAELVPHLVSRLIYTGAGGFDLRDPELAFTLSPRVACLEREVSPGSVDDRGIFHQKDEALCQGGYHRLHLICGESLCSELASYLRLGATALVVRLVELGDRPGSAVRLCAPLEAMRRFAADPSGRAVARLAAGRRWRAVEIQRHYLEAVERRLGEPGLPAWAGPVCRAWRDTLDRLEGAPESVATSLDWAIKLSIARARVERRAREARVPALRTRRRRPRGSAAELCEIDARFGQIGGASGESIFARLERAGVLEHRVDAVGDAAPAMHEPPSGGRARARGLLVRELASAGRRYRADWDRVFDTQTGRFADLRDPFVEAPATWSEPRPAPVRPALPRTPSGLEPAEADFDERQLDFQSWMRARLLARRTRDDIAF